MTFASPENITALSTMVIHVNEISGGWLTPMLVVMTFMILLLSLNSRFEWGDAWISSGFVTLLLSFGLYYAKQLDLYWLVILFVMLVGGGVIFKK